MTIKDKYNNTHHCWNNNSHFYPSFIWSSLISEFQEKNKIQFFSFSSFIGNWGSITHCILFRRPFSFSAFISNVFSFTYCFSIDESSTEWNMKSPILPITDLECSPQSLKFVANRSYVIIGKRFFWFVNRCLFSSRMYTHLDRLYRKIWICNFCIQLVAEGMMPG